MKKILFLCAFFALGLMVQAQKVTIKDKEVLVDGKYWAMMETQGVALNPDGFSIKSKAGKELIYLKSIGDPEKSEGRFLVVFMDLDMQGELELLGLNMKKSLATQLVKQGVLENEQLVPEKVKAFVRKFPAKEEPKPATAHEAEYTYTIVERDNTKDIDVTGILDGEIRQDFETIGKYNQSDKMIDGTNTSVIEITLPDGKLVAECRFPLFGSKEKQVDILTLKNNTKHQISTKKDANVLKEVVKWLVDRKYL